jgi:hypothetical protein
MPKKDLSTSLSQTQRLQQGHRHAPAGLVDQQVPLFMRGPPGPRNGPKVANGESSFKSMFLLLLPPQSLTI